MVRDGEAIDSLPVTAPGIEHRFHAVTPGRYRLQLESGAVVVAVSSPIYLEARRSSPPRLPLQRVLPALGR